MSEESFNEEPFEERAYDAHAGGEGTRHLPERPPKWPSEGGGERLKMVRRSQRQGEQPAAAGEEDGAPAQKTFLQKELLPIQELLGRLEGAADRVEQAATRLQLESGRFLGETARRQGADADGPAAGGRLSARAPQRAGQAERMRPAAAWVVAAVGLTAIVLVAVVLMAALPSAWSEPVRLTREERLMVAVGREAFGRLTEAEQRALRELHRMGRLGAAPPVEEASVEKASRGDEAVRRRAGSLEALVR